MSNVTLRAFIADRTNRQINIAAANQSAEEFEGKTSKLSCAVKIKS